MSEYYEDSDLVSRLNNGGEKALDELFIQFYQALCFYAIRIISNKEQAEDIVVECFSKLWNRRTDFDNLHKMKGFLYISTRNACYDFLKHRGRVQAAHHEIFFLQDAAVSHIDDPEKTRAEVLRKLYEEIEKLPKLCRQVFELSVFEGLKTKDIAERMDISISNVTSQKSRAVQLLRSAMLKRLLIDMLILYYFYKKNL
jgi:RNA polymerase sigma-70 factor (family 1)